MTATSTTTLIAIKPLVWSKHKSLVGYKLLCFDCFGNEFDRIDLKHNLTEAMIEEIKKNTQAKYEHCLLKHIIIKGE